MMSNIRGINLCGASGTGKTTLANYVASRYGYTKLESAARKTLAMMGLEPTDFAKLLADEELYADYQIRLPATQLRLEQNCPVAFVSDRAFDNLPYSALYGTCSAEIAKSSVMKEYIQTLKEGRLIFFVRPTWICLKAALMDGDRKEFLIWEDMHRLDGMIQFILETEKIPHHPISTPDLHERKRLIDGILQSHGVIPTEAR